MSRFFRRCNGLADCAAFAVAYGAALTLVLARTLVLALGLRLR